MPSHNCYNGFMDLIAMRQELRRLTMAAVHKGPVTLASGKISDFYIDGRLVTLSAEGLYLTACLMADLLKDDDFDAVGGPTMGADPLVGALLYHFWSTEQRRIDGFIIRKEAKGHGMQKMIEGLPLPEGARAVLVEDIVTSGGSIIKAAKAVEEAGAHVVKMLALVDREEGAHETLAAAGYDFEAIFTRSELIS
ncbi:MAG: orotate phosphoribosyltransferase [Actinomycetota bacterium]|nr:orotate phosphoribosyltransferase [Actinomycetota bacterium]